MLEGAVPVSQALVAPGDDPSMQVEAAEPKAPQIFTEPPGVPPFPQVAAKVAIFKSFKTGISHSIVLTSQ